LSGTVLIVGATGLIGKAFLRQISNDKWYSEISILARREVTEFKTISHFKQHIIDFEKLQNYKNLINTDTIVCTLGTTIKKAGTQENFRRIDYGLPLQIAQFGIENGVKNFILVSAVGADPNSKVFYNRVKGELESDLQELDFKSLHILQPSLLLGERDERRFAENFSKLIFKPFMSIIPWKYKPIYDHVLANKIDSIIKNSKPGIFFYEGKSLYS